MTRWVHRIALVLMMAMIRWGGAFQKTRWNTAIRRRNQTRKPFIISTSIHSSSNPQQQSPGTGQSTEPPPENENSGDASSSSSSSTIIRRQQALHESLQKIHLDPNLIYEANQRNLQDPLLGYDPQFGRPAIRTYRSFLNSKKVVVDETLPAKADGCARHIDFLRRRHLAHNTDWVRHTDTDDKIVATNSGNGQQHQATTTQEQEQLPPTTSTSRFPIILILDNIRSAFNVGSLFRTADACGIREVITTGITAHPNGAGAEKLSKSALGAERIVSHRHFSSTQDALITLQQEYPDWSLIGMETTNNSIDYTHVEYPSQCIVILGNEVTGIDPSVLVELDYVCEIPMFGAKNSLNVAACAPVVLYEIIRQWGVSNTNQKDA